MVNMITLCAFGQVEYKDTVRSITITGYVGVFAGPSISLKTGKASGFATLRAGGTASFSPKKWISFYGLGAFDINEAGKALPLYLLGIKLKPSKMVLVTIGRIASPMTELRPIPTTMFGQVEASTRAKILGPGLGGKITLTPHKNFSLNAGGFWRNTDATTELVLGIPYFKIGGYYGIQSKTFGGVVDFSYQWFSQLVVYNHTKELSFNTWINIPKTDGVGIYSDWTMSTQPWKFARGEWGVLKIFSYKIMKVLVGVGSGVPLDKNPYFNGYVMVTL